MSCCVPTSATEATALSVSNRAGHDASPTVSLPGGTFAMGDDGPMSYPDNGEGPVRTMHVDPLVLDAYAVSNERFAAFVEDTAHVTDAEQVGWSFVFGGLLPDDFPDTRGVEGAPWWRQVHAADWRHPEGPHSGLDGRLDHPVVQVSARDAAAFAAWAGRRLPTEAEWEYAARAGASTTFPWGDDLEPDGEHRANVWQGAFPAANTLADGYLGTCPVDAFAPSAFGTHNMIGNVWEWTADAWGEGRVLKGGSYLCHASYCRRYRPAARTRASLDSSMGNTGFRCAGVAA